MAILNGGKILSQGTPKAATEALAGKIWTKTIEQSELNENQAAFNVISSNFNQDNTMNIRVYSDELPNESFELATPQLEDVYFVTLKKDQ
jgi:CHASE3 domain sensor protein